MVYYVINIDTFKEQRAWLNTSKPDRIWSHADLFLDALLENFNALTHDISRQEWHIRDASFTDGSIVMLDVDTVQQKITPCVWEHIAGIKFPTLHGLNTYESFQKVLETMKKSWYTDKVIQRIHTAA